jgi:glycosyltransferase involved in cell wall biosynthesis
MHLKIIIPAYNSVKWISKTLNSVASQTYKNYDVCVIDDASTQPKQQEIIGRICEKNKWKAVYRQKNQGALANIVDGIKWLSPFDEDLILLLDGDDWLYNEHVFAKIVAEYTQAELLLTYGQFITYPRWQKGLCKPLTEQILKNQNFKEIPFAFSHLRTFKYKIWKMIQERDLKDSNGNFYRTAWDLAIMYPLLELSGGGGCKFIEEILYVYNMDNPLNDCIAHRELQERTAAEILKKEPYKRQFFVADVPHQAKWSTQIRIQWASIYKKIITPIVYLLAVKKLLKISAALIHSPYVKRVAFRLKRKLRG